MQSSEYLSPSYRSLRKTTVKDLTVVARLQIQADKAVRYIAHVDNTNESAREKLNMAKGALSDIIVLLHDMQGKLNTSQKDVEEDCTVNNSIQAIL